MKGVFFGRAKMRKIIISIAAVFLMLIAGLVLLAKDQKSTTEQKPGQELVFPKGQVEEHPSDLHMGSDPYYHEENKKYEGTDEKGYPRDYDPSMQYYESTTTYKRVDKKKKPEPQEPQE